MYIIEYIAYGFHLWYKIKIVTQIVRKPTSQHPGLGTSLLKHVLPLLGRTFRLLLSLGSPPPRPLQTVGLRPPSKLTNLCTKSYMNQGGRRPTIPGGSGGRSLPVKKSLIVFFGIQAMPGIVFTCLRCLLHAKGTSMLGVA